MKPVISMLKQVMIERRIKTAELSRLVGRSVSQVCNDVMRIKVSVEKAIEYARALNVHPCRLRPDIFDEKDQIQWKPKEDK